jgi:hypothetical protein
MDERSCSREVLLAWINHRLERISEVQHRLAADRTMLQEQATRLRLGVSADEVRAALKRAGCLGRAACREASDGPRVRAAADNGRGGGLA